MPLIAPQGLSRRSFSLALAASAAVLRANEPEMRWALLSDTHIPENPEDAYRGFRPVENLRKAVPMVLEAKPQGALLCGDAARLLGTPGDYRALQSLLEPVATRMPVAIALGNHDDRKNFLAVFGASQKGVQPVKNRHVLVIEGPAVRFIVLDSLIQPNFTPGLLGKDQRTWLAQYLDAAAPLPTVLFMHHTPDDGDTALLDMPRLMDIIRGRTMVKAVVFGHSHRYLHLAWEGIHMINLPALGYNFSDEEPVGWVDAVFTARGASLTLRAIGGNTERDGKTVVLSWRA
ncbi:MAG: metallophosphoesterase [Bryobacteraceae bacterium]|nr:metallophosphoesterase [Bryobacteraceae bacterium]